MAEVPLDIAAIRARAEAASVIAFVSSARTDVPTLCDEVERLRAELEEVRALLAKSLAPTFLSDRVMAANEKAAVYRAALRELASAERETLQALGDLTFTRSLYSAGEVPTSKLDADQKVFTRAQERLDAALVAAERLLSVGAGHE